MSGAGQRSSSTSSRLPVAPIPRLPVLSWDTFSGDRDAELPCLLDHSSVQFTTSGRASILLALERLGIKQGDKVLVPSYHCPTMVAPLVALGAEPIFFGIDTSGAPRVDSLDTATLQGARAMLAAHYFGIPQPMQALRAWCDARGLALIEDCAHALFGRSGNSTIGTTGDIAIGSLTKFLPVPEGGCLVINRSVGTGHRLSKPSLIQQIKAFIDTIHIAANHQRLKGFNGLFRGAFALRQVFKRSATPAATDTPAGEEAMDGFTLDVELSHRQLTQASTWMAEHAPRQRIVEQRRRHFQTMLNALRGMSNIHPLFTELPQGAAPYVFPLWVAEPDPGYAELRRLGIPVSRWDRLWPSTPRIAADAGRDWSHHVLQLACHQDLSDTEISHIVATVVSLYENTPHAIARSRLQTSGQARVDLAADQARG